MNQTVKIKKPNRKTAKEELENLSKEELISMIQSLEAHNVQLQNIINKSNHTTSIAKMSDFDFSKCKFRHILLHVFYLGWDYRGFAVQEDTTNTVEHHLFQALRRTCLIKDRSSSNYHRCGRTDKGVSSFGQVISINVRSVSDNADNEIDYCKVLNRVLPNNIQCVAWAAVEEDFSARFDCTCRTYKYYFPKGKLNIQKMQEACRKFIGSHDFRNFAKMDVGNGVVQFTRNIKNFQIEDLSSSMYVAIIKGNAFIWHQIRYMMGILFLIGSDKEEPSIIDELLNVETNPRKPDYNMANEIPLNLFYCEYENARWHVSQENLKCVIDTMQQIWTFSNVKSVMIKDIINNLYGKLDNKDETKCLSEHLVAGVKAKNYVPVMKRQKCESLENKIVHYSKRKRIEIIPSDP
ncbi:unnamed protein product [Ceutorhynchus assimilis]|uniref:Pseudouridine synthase I TruA alpha/beta domain-containing protein n=1 Tax=Ceutorhynchus assimilis TaxID=467358 RepID=A0A9N9MKJ4_9CUCU|nr:unnamed protein product [Ceutorhynchus assimilis]